MAYHRRSYHKLVLKIVYSRDNTLSQSEESQLPDIACLVTSLPETTFMDVYGTWNREIRDDYDCEDPTKPQNSVVHDGGIYWYFELAPEYYKELTDKILNRPYNVVIYVNDIMIEERDYEISEDNMYIYGIWSEELDTYKPTNVVALNAPHSGMSNNGLISEMSSYLQLMQKVNNYYGKYMQADNTVKLLQQAPVRSKKTQLRWIIIPIVEKYNGRWQRGLRVPTI